MHKISAGQEDESWLCLLAGYSSSYMVIPLVWILSAAIAVPPLLGWSYFTPESSGISCAPAWEDMDYATYTIYILTLGFIVPVAVLVTSSAYVIYYNRKETQRYMRTFTLASEKTKEKRFRKERRINIMTMIMFFSFNASWFPYAILCFIKLFKPHLITPTATVFPLLLAKRLKHHNY